MLLGPSAHLPIPNFPAFVRLAVFSEFTGGHGRYTPSLSLRDASGDEVWHWSAADPFTHTDPLLPHEVVFQDLQITVPKPGRYTLVMLLNGDDAAQRTVWLGPSEVFRAPDAY